MFFCTDDEESTEFIGLISACTLQYDTSREVSYSIVDLNVRSATCHIGCDRNGSVLSGSSDNVGFLGILLGIEDIVRNTFFGKEGREVFALFCDTDRSDKNRLSFFMELLYELDYIVEFSFFGTEQEITAVIAGDGAVGWNSNDLEGIDLVKFFLFGFCRTGHSGKLLIETKNNSEK